MLTYGLVKQVGPYARPYPARYKVQNKTVISPRYPYDPSGDSTAVHNRSAWAARVVPDGPDPTSKTQLQREKQQQQDMQLNVVIESLFGNTFGTETDESETKTMPGITEPQNIGEPEPVSYPNIKEEEDIEEMNLVPLEPSNVNWRRGIVSAIRQGSQILQSASTPLQAISGYMRTMIPLVGHLVDTDRLTLNAGLTLLLGRDYARPLIDFLRTRDDLRTQLTRAFTDYVVEPSANVVRDFVSDPDNFVNLALQESFEGAQAVTPWLDQLAEDLSTTATQTAGDRAMSLVGLLLNTLVATEPMVAPRISGPIGPVGTIVGGYNLRRTPARTQANTVLLRNFQQAGNQLTNEVLRYFRRRAGTR